MTKIYRGGFADWSEVALEFEIKRTEPEAIFALYDCGWYDGRAYILYIEGGKLFHVYGSHCSCYGLEDQWEPEEMPLAAVEKMLTGGGGLAKEGAGDWLSAVKGMVA